MTDAANKTAVLRKDTSLIRIGSSLEDAYYAKKPCEKKGKRKVF
jgi:hypothetical protein